MRGGGRVGGVVERRRIVVVLGVVIGRIGRHVVGKGVVAAVVGHAGHVGSTHAGLAQGIGHVIVGVGQVGRQRRRQRAFESAGRRIVEHSGRHMGQIARMQLRRPQIRHLAV